MLAVKLVFSFTMIFYLYLIFKLKDGGTFRNKRSQAKGVYYVFLYKQQLDNVYTRVAVHRFALSPLHAVAHGC